MDPNKNNLQHRHNPLFNSIAVSLGRRLSGDEYIRLQNSVRSRRFSRVRRLHTAMTLKTNDPLSRVMARIETRAWIKTHTIVDEVEKVAGQIVEKANTMSKGIDTPDSDRLIANVVICDLYEALDFFADINDPTDPICVACVEVALKKLDLVMDVQN